MLLFLEWLDKLNEDVSQQIKIFTTKIQNLFPGIDVKPFLTVLIDGEKEIYDEDDRRRSATAHKFISKYKPNPSDSQAHALDRFRFAFAEEVSKANAKTMTPEQLGAETLLKLRSKLPNAPEEVIQELKKQVSQGARIDSVVNAYIASQKAIEGEDKVVATQGNLELIEINSFRAGGKEKHIDTGELEDCHILLRKTGWCVRFKDYFDRYIYSDGPLYLVRENGKPLAVGNKENKFLDVEDEVPSTAIMNKIAPIVASTQIFDLVKWVAPWLKFKDAIKLPESEDYFKFMAGEYVTVTEYYVVFDYFSNYDALKRFVEYNTRNPCMPDIDSISDNVLDQISHVNLIDECIALLPLKFINKIEEKLDAKHKDEEDWDYLDFDEKLNKDDKTAEAIKEIIINAFVSGTKNYVHEKTMEALADPDVNGFFIEYDPNDNDYRLMMYYEQFMENAQIKINNNDKSKLIDYIKINGDCDLDIDLTLDKQFLYDEISKLLD